MKHKKTLGFSLLEISIVFAIVSILLPLLIDIISIRITQDRRKVTEAKLQYIQKAMDIFVSTNYRLPCPAEILNVDIYSTQFGLESRYFASTGPFCQTDLSSGLTGSDTSLHFIKIGGIPTKTLMIDDDYAFDGWGRRISFFISRNCGAADSEKQSGGSNRTGFGSSNPTMRCGGDPATSFTIYNNSYLSANNKGFKTTNMAMYVLISHGESGHGAFTNSVTNSLKDRVLSLTNTKLGIGSTENSHCSSTSCGKIDKEFVQREPYRKTASSYTSVNPQLTSVRNNFDDIVVYKTRQQQLYDSGLYDYDSEDCALATSVGDIWSEVHCNATNTDCKTVFDVLQNRLTQLCK